MAEVNISCYETWGTDIMNCMLLQQYRDSQNLKEYINAFVEEINTLYCEVQKVELGRYVDHAEGKQLDIIGDIIGANRTRILIEEKFGFLYAEGAKTFGKLGDDNVGGYFRSLYDDNHTITPVGDIQYRNIIRARLYCIGSQNRGMESEEFLNYAPNFNSEDIYKIIEILINEVPDGYLTSGIVTDYIEYDNTICVEVDETKITELQLSLLYNIRGWFIPTIKNFEIKIFQAAPPPPLPPS